MKIFTIANLKGGVGKTITTVNVAYLLAAEQGRRVLVVDNDQQGNASLFLAATAMTSRAWPRCWRARQGQRR